ncbi:MAG TPA: PilZ domain-containing protein [Thermoanaerobaculia bacterium]
MARPHFSPDETARILALPATAVTQLISSGRLIAKGASIAADSIETFLRDRFLELYRAEAAPQAQAQQQPEPQPQTQQQPIAPPQDEHTIDLEQAEAAAAERLEITRSFNEYEVDARPERPNMRIAPRYVPRRQLGGSFRGTRFTVLQLSTTGLRIRHEESMRPGDVARLTLSLMRPARTFAMQARVVWTSIAQRGDGPSFCISGLRVVENADQLRQAIDLLREGRDLQQDEGARRGTPASLTGLSDDDVAAIIRAVRKFSADPVEANRWYTRARFALAEESVRNAAPPRARDREEVVGVWEYLDRKVDLHQIAGVVTWLRQTRSASAG